MGSDEYTMLANVDDARNAHREQQLEGAVLGKAIAEAEKAALDELRGAMPARATRLGAEAFQVQARLDDASKRATGLYELTGVDEASMSWDVIAGTLAQRLTQEEEILVRSEDEATNAAAYNIDPSDARFAYRRQQARVEAFRKAYLDAKTKSGDDTPSTQSKRGRSGRHPAESE